MEMLKLKMELKSLDKIQLKVLVTMKKKLVNKFGISLIYLLKSNLKMQLMLTDLLIQPQNIIISTLLKIYGKVGCILEKFLILKII
jgi:hypothetical protein